MVGVKMVKKSCFDVGGVAHGLKLVGVVLLW